ncbi:MAG: hypothetical protein CMF38_07780 [Legionellaceae bacterium]|nr:hypothetical protein [Legionellaceae bacterium]HCA89930.1 hypothetical protein [Legionellales bacterium]|tara:strand:- start:86 stop:946 length:861 start_codon:yes stop_codon:yes gene_type:complete
MIKRVIKMPSTFSLIKVKDYVMNKTILAACILSVCANSFAGTMGEPVAELPYFAKIGAGYAWSNQADVRPNSPSWDPAIQGYNADLGQSTFYFLEMGKTIHPFVDVSLSYINHDEFDYQKYQTTPTPVPLTPGFTGNSRTRFFDVNNQSILFNINLHAPQSYTALMGFEISPFIEGGIGYAHNEVKNFHTVGLVFPPGGGSTTSIGKDTHQSSFAAQGSAGINLHPENTRFSMDIGYRYYYGGKFHAPATVLSNTASNPGQFVTATAAWDGKVRANEAYIALKFVS